jgi:hypothetical protein
VRKLSRSHSPPPSDTGTHDRRPIAFSALDA